MQHLGGSSVRTIAMGATDEFAPWHESNPDGIR